MTEVDRERYSEDEYERMRERLGQCLTALDTVLQRPGFGDGPRTLGAEVEMFLVDDDAHPFPRNDDVHAAVGDPRLTLEVDRFNVEANLTPVPLEGRPFTTMGGEMAELHGAVDAAAGDLDGRALLIGTLPTLTPADLGSDAVTDRPRYRALDHRLRTMRTRPFRIDIAGEDHLLAEADDVSLEGANTSFQLHVRVAPADFVDLYNAAQIATAPVLAASGNSPFFLGHRLWDETRIALFQQSVDHRDDVGARLAPARVAFGSRWLESTIDAFAHAVRAYEPLLPELSDDDPRAAAHVGQVPGLDELRLHMGSVWTWNRPVYDPGAGGHLRVELRALPAGPTPVDMAANGAFLLGLSLAVAEDAAAWTAALPFTEARDNFFAAARHGLDATLASPFGRHGLERVGARELALRVLEPARDALVRAGVEDADVDDLFAVVEARTTSGRTGAHWQRTVVDHFEPRLGRHRAMHAMTQRYADAQATGAPVHTWPLPG